MGPSVAPTDPRTREKVFAPVKIFREIDNYEVREALLLVTKLKSGCSPWRDTRSRTHVDSLCGPIPGTLHRVRFRRKCLHSGAQFRQRSHLRAPRRGASKVFPP